jgi:pantoate--beta-alanine ligase
MTGSERRPDLVAGLPELRTRVAAARRLGRSVGLVPTMGALHEGHASLVRAARAQTGFVVASIFVNPLQFGPGEDLDRYPRTLEADRELLGRAGADVLWHPTAEAMVTADFAISVDAPALASRLCGRSRPGHFRGVLTIVAKLLLQVQPDLAWFGRKDYQQALLVRRLVRDLDFPVGIRVAPIVREADGLAMSSRNRYLAPEERRAAPALRAALLAVGQAFGAGETSVAGLLARGKERLARESRVRLDYLEICDPESLEARPAEARPGDLVAVAAHLGSARLIDNLLLGED